MSRRTIKAGEGFTIEEILNSDGFTLDTGDFADLVDDEEDAEMEYRKNIQLSNEEMLRYLNLEDDDESGEVGENETISFVGISFDTIRPRMYSIYGDGEVMKLVKKEGTGEVVPPDAQVTVEYVGYFEHQEEPFDSTFYTRDKKMVLRLGKGQIIQGLEIAIASMRKHEKALFLIKPSLAYGELGCLPRIPPKAEVLFKIDLIDFLDNGQADLYEQLSNEEKKRFPAIKQIVLSLLNTAKDSYGRDRVKQAIREYQRTVHYLETARLEDDEEERQMNKLLTKALTNLTICYNKVNKPKLTCACFQKLPTETEKALFHYGKALKQLGEYDEAMRVLQKAHRQSPSNEEVLKEIKLVEEFRQKYLDNAKRFARNCLNLPDNSVDDEFEQTAIEMCDNFINNPNLLKEEIPQGLSAQEQDCIRRVAASKGLSITKHTRYNSETLFLTKKSYYIRDM